MEVLHAEIPLIVDRPARDKIRGNWVAEVRGPKRATWTVAAASKARQIVGAQAAAMVSGEIVALAEAGIVSATAAFPREVARKQELLGMVPDPEA